MSKSHPSITTVQLERRQAAKERRQRLDWIWAIIMLSILVGFIGFYIAILISHHA
jgi:uncharacterized membrane protein (DUF485 family)